MINTLIGPLSLIILAITFCVSLISLRSHFIKDGTDNFLLAHVLTNFSDSSTFISTKKTLLCCSQKCSTIDAPIPEPPPVINTTLFSKSKYFTFIYNLSSVFRSNNDIWSKSKNKFNSLFISILFDEGNFPSNSCPK